MKEIEVKILEVDKNEIIKKLESFGAKQTFEGSMKVCFFDFPGDKLREKNKRLRLRKAGGKTQITLKSNIKKGDAIICDEYETEIKDQEIALKIFDELGLKIIREYEKYRTSYAIDKMFFEIDEIQGCPTYIEIEGPSVEMVYEWVEKLGYEASDAVSLSGREVVEEYEKN